jgi:Peptidoglycan-binding protein, CsiV
MKRIAALILTLLAMTVAVAQQQGTGEQPEPEEPKSYTVEIIIFTYTEPVGVGTEIFPPDVTEPAAEPAAETDEESAADAGTGMRPEAESAEATASENEPRTVEYRVLTNDDFTMQDVLDRLQRLDAYQPVMHFGWTQPAHPQDETPPIELHTFGEPPPGLDGTFTLYLSRFLHLVVDLSLEAPDSAADQPVVHYGDDRGRFGSEEPQQPVHYRIQENRIVKNGDVRYFDHPKFGVLAKITRVDDDEESTDGSGPQALARKIHQLAQHPG